MPQKSEEYEEYPPALLVKLYEMDEKPNQETAIEYESAQVKSSLNGTVDCM